MSETIQVEACLKIRPETSGKTMEDNMSHRTMHWKNISWLLWPFIAIWRLVTTILEMVGRFVAMVLGLVFFLGWFLLGF